MVFWTPYPWYIEPPTYDSLTSLSMVFWPPYPWYFVPYTWYVDPPTMVCWPPLYMVYCTPYPLYLTSYPWYFNPPTHGISRGSIYHEGFKIQWWNIDPGVNISWKLTPGSKYHMTPVLQPKTSKTLFRPVHFLVI